MSRRALLALAAALAAAVTLAACGGGSSPSAQTSAPDRTTTQVQVIRTVADGNGFAPEAVYREAAPSVVTVISVFDGGGLGGLLGGGQAGQGSGFVVSGSGEIATNAHVVTNGQAPQLSKANQVFVKFADGNEVSATIVGFDPSADVAMLKIDPSGLTLHPLALADSAKVAVGEPVAAIGSPFGEPQSLSVGVISATGRSIQSLNKFQIAGALQTDAAINHGNSGGPLLNASGQVIGINSQIESTGGGGEGVGFAVPSNLVRRSLDELRAHGTVRYAYMGVATAEVYPQLARRFGLPDHGAWIQTVSRGGPGEHAGLRGGGPTATFQAEPYRTGGDVILAIDDRRVADPDALGEILLAYRPGQQVRVTVFRGGGQRTIRVTLGNRSQAPGGG